MPQIISGIPQVRRNCFCHNVTNEFSTDFLWRPDVSGLSCRRIGSTKTTAVIWYCSACSKRSRCTGENAQQAPQHEVVALSTAGEAFLVREHGSDLTSLEHWCVGENLLQQKENVVHSVQALLRIFMLGSDVRWNSWFDDTAFRMTGICLCNLAIIMEAKLHVFDLLLAV